MTSRPLRGCAQSAFLLAILIANGAQAQLTALNDPANLAGERVSAPPLTDTLPINHGTLALQQLLRKLRTRASFMLIVAHPDDEDNGALTYLSRGQGARVATLTLNRGEGGQNLMSADFGDALGLIRTQELLAADRYMGVDQFFGTEIDFGFSKTKEESFAKWTHDRVLYDAVRAIRLYRPLVIASVFRGDPSDGHGQHQVSGQIAQEAFNAAGDPTVFPDQGLPPWQPLKVYARSPFARIDAQGMYDYATNQYVPVRFTNYVTGKVTNTVPRSNVIVSEGDTDPLLGGRSYADFGREGRSQQRSQMGGGGGQGGRGGRADVSYHRYGSRLHQPDGDDSALESSFFDGIDTSIQGIASLAPDAPSSIKLVLKVNLGSIDQYIADAQHAFNAEHPDLTAPHLRDAISRTDTLIGNLESLNSGIMIREQQFNLLHELRIKRVQLNDALLLADGVTLQATIAPQGALNRLLTTAPRIDVKTTLSTGSAPVEIKSIALNFLGVPGHIRPSPGISSDAKLHVPAHLQPHSIRKQPLSAIVDKELPPTRPYFSHPTAEQPFYDVSDPALRNAPATPAPLTVSVTLSDQGVPLTLEAIVADPAEIAPRQPAVVVPPVSVCLPVSAAVVPIQNRSFPLSYSASTPQSEFVPHFQLDLPGHWVYTLPPDLNSAIDTSPTGRLSRQTAMVNIVDPAPYRVYPITVVAEMNGHQYREGYRSIGYPGVEHTNFYTPSTFRVTAVNLTTAPNLNVAYLPGTGDDVPSGLDQLGVHPHILVIADLTQSKLAQYDAVILGVRAYTAHPELSGAGSQPLIEYARQGGVVIAQYNNGRYGDAEAPFPIAVAASSGDHAHDVVDESAPVTILAPGSPALSWPNQITPADFDNWVEERGHSFAASWASQYQSLVETHDPGQEPQRGGLLVAHVGRGAYVYLGLALYRQLPEGVPGPYRIFANLISLAKNPVFHPIPLPAR